MNYKAESLNRLDFPLKFGDRPCRIYGADCAEYLLLQMTDEHELQHMDNEISAIAQGSAHSFLFAAVPVKTGTMNFPRGNLLRCGAKKVSAAMRRAHYAF